jgi:hypothetical protein
LFLNRGSVAAIKTPFDPPLLVRPEVCHLAWKEDRYAEEAIQALTG